LFERSKMKNKDSEKIAGEGKIANNGRTGKVDIFGLGSDWRGMRKIHSARPTLDKDQDV